MSSLTMMVPALLKSSATSIRARVTLVNMFVLMTSSPDSVVPEQLKMNAKM